MENNVSFRPKLQIKPWVKSYLEVEAKKRGKRLGDLVSEAISDWAYADDDFSFKVAEGLPEVNEKWKSYQKEMAKKARQTATLKRQRAEDSSGDMSNRVSDIEDFESYR